MKLNIDRAILRDIMEARATNERRNSYYVVGSIFSGMSFTMLLLGSDNYTAISALVMVGMMFYSCISCNKIDFEESEFRGENKEYDEQEEAEEPYMKVDEMTLDEKINLFKELFYELSNIRLEDEELERMLTTVNYAEEEEAAEEEEFENEDVKDNDKVKPKGGVCLLKMKK
jgi:predicted RNase H-like nuclease (RuvC/YqgF family)